MAKESTDFVCDLGCPSNDVGKGYCCRYCASARKKYVNDENRHLWNKDNGFYSNNGCRLTREKMPKECKEYDCRGHTFVIIRRWIKGRWHDIRIGELHNSLIPPEENNGQIYCARF